VPRSRAIRVCASKHIHGSAEMGNAEPEARREEHAALPFGSSRATARAELALPAIPGSRRERVPPYCFCSCSSFSNFFTLGATTSRQYPCSGFFAK
jgi:hypothetical protein